jgi:D-amino-acid dehydrogenase
VIQGRQWTPTSDRNLTSDRILPARLKRQTLVIGGGIVGLCCAYHLLKSGHAVTVVDRGPRFDGASCGNAGGIAKAEVIPLAAPGVIFQVPGWLLDPLGPLSIRWSYLPRLAPWLYLFLRSSPRARMEAGAMALARLLEPALDDHRSLLKEAGLTGLLREQGSLYVYRSARNLTADQDGWALRRRLGVRFTKLDRADIEDREPCLGPRAQVGYHVEDWAHYTDPCALVMGIADLVERSGARFVAATIDDLEAAGGRARSARTDRGEAITFDNLVIAAGAWSSILSKKLGEPFPLESERGYNTTIPDPGVRINNYVAFADDQFVMTPLSVGLRVGGAVELAGLETPPNYDRAKALAKRAQQYVPDLNTEGGREWMGHRPSPPDSLPVIGRSARFGNVFHAFGHGHLGLTMSATTGRVIADLVSGRAPDIDVAPFRIDRFT